jgi:hypothetical protein
VAKEQSASRHIRAFSTSRPATQRILSSLILVFTASSTWAANSAQITREVILSPGNFSQPQGLTTMSNGDLIVVGASNGKRWATRVSEEGRVLWNYQADDDIPGPSGNQFDSATELPNKNVLLCGVRQIERKHDAVLVRLKPDGSFIDERVLEPTVKHMAISPFSCVPWNGGVAVVNGGWLTKLNSAGDIEWQKFDDNYYGVEAGMIPTSDQSLILMSSQGISRVDSAGNVTTHRFMQLGDVSVCVPMTKAGGTFSLVTQNPELSSTVLVMNADFTGPVKQFAFDNVHPKRAYQRADGTCVVFGSHFKGQALAAIAQLDSTGHMKMLADETTLRAAWVIDAVPTNGAGKFAIVQLAAANATKLQWVSLR